MAGLTVDARADVAEIVAEQLADFEHQVAEAIAHGLRLHAENPPLPGMSVTYGTVSAVNAPAVTVVLDADGSAVDAFTSAIVTAGQRVAVLVVPPSGALILGPYGTPAGPSGWTPATGTAARTTFDTATVTLVQLAQRVKALVDDLHALGVLTT